MKRWKMCRCVRWVNDGPTVQDRSRPAQGAVIRDGGPPSVALKGPPGQRLS